MIAVKKVSLLRNFGKSLTYDLFRPVYQTIEKEFSKFDRYTQRLLSSWIKKNLSDTSNPRLHGKALSGNLKGLWRYRIGDYRLICEINDDELVILAVSVGHRREINQQ